MDEELKGDLGDDDLDASLRRTLGRAPGSMDPTAEAWEQLTPRLRHARRRYRAGIVGASLLVLGGVSAAALATDPMGQRNPVIVPASGPGEATTTTGGPDTAKSTSVEPGDSTIPTIPTIPTRRDKSTLPGGGTVGGAPGAISVPGEGETTATTVAPDETLTYTAPGGRVTVRFSGGALTLLDSSANPGYAAEVQNVAADEIEVRFHPTSGPESRIRVRIEGGTVSPEIE